MRHSFQLGPYRREPHQINEDRRRANSSHEQLERIGPPIHLNQSGHFGMIIVRPRGMGFIEKEGRLIQRKFLYAIETSRCFKSESGTGRGAKHIGRPARLLDERRDILDFTINRIRRGVRALPSPAAIKSKHSECGFRSLAMERIGPNLLWQSAPSTSTSAGPGPDRSNAI